ncbi:2877_t:CDS:2, partial [Scutellospora calospora]
MEFYPPMFYIISKLHKNPITSYPITPSHSWITSDISNLAIGSSVLPVAANLYMAKILINAFGDANNIIFNNIIYIRSYINYVFAIMTDSYSCEFMANRISNTAFPSGFILGGTTANKVSFLDLNLETCLMLSESRSAYRDIQGENIRLIWNSDNFDAYNQALKEFKYFLSNQKYPIVE